MPALKTRSPRASKAAQLLPVEDMTGGVDLRRSQTLLAPNRARTLKNYSLEEPGALIMRPGYLAASTATFGGTPQGGQRVYLARSVFSVMALDGAVYNPSDAWVKGAAVHSTISSGTQVFFPYDRDLVAVMDGVNRPYFSTNGANWLLFGTDAPSSAAVLSSVQSVGGAISTGTVEVVYTHKHRGTAHESNASPTASVRLEVSSANSVHVAASPSTDAKVDAFVFYARKTVPDQEAVFRKVSSGAASTYTILSSAWTTADELSTNHNVPATGLKFAAIWKNRWWAPDGTVGNRLRFTEIFQNQSWPTDYFIDIPFEKGDSITAVQPLGDTLLVYGQSGIFLIIGQTSLDFEVRPSQGADTGAFGPRAVAKVEQAAAHASGDGLNSFDSAADRNLEHDISPAWRDLVQNTAGVSLEKVALLHDHLRHELRVSVPRVYPTGARGEWVLNLDRTRDNDGVPAWTTTDRDIAFYMHWNGNEPTAGNRGRLFTINSSGGFIFEENVGASANSSNMTAEYEGPALALGLHRARFGGLHVEVEPHGGTYSVELVVDGLSQGAISIDIGSGLYTYGSSAATYGTALYGGAGRLKRFTPMPLSAEGQTAVLKTVYVGQERAKTYGYTHLITPEPAPRQL